MYIGDLRIGAQRARHIDLAVADVRGDDLLGRLSLLAPALHHGHLVELVGTLAAGAMLHARNHEEPQPIALIRTHGLEHRAVEIDCVAGRNGLIGPAVIEQQLAAVFLERRKIGGVRVDAGLVGQRDVRGQIELVIIVIGVLVAQDADAVPSLPPGSVGVVLSAAYCNSPPGS